LNKKYRKGRVENRRKISERTEKDMNIKKKSLAIIIVIVFVLGAGVGFSAGQLLPAKSGSSESGDSGNVKDRYSKIDELYDIIEEQYYKDPNEKKMTDGMARGLFWSLGDKYSSYMTKKEYQSYDISVTGEFEGIGVTFQENKKGDYVVINVVKDSPAEKAGIKVDDLLLKVNGKTYDDVDKMAADIRGKDGTKVKLTIKHNGKEKTLEITRGKIVIDTVEGKMLKDKIGYIQINSFEKNTEEDYRNTFDSLEKKNMKGLIIDLRDNGGGLIEKAINIADTLMGKSVITYLEDRAGKREYFDSDEDQIDIPYVILVNGNTASASEILTAAVKDKGQGKIVGTKTYGKGVVQISGELSDGSGYKLTVAQYFSPDGKTINKKGVKPDYKVKGKKKQLEKAIELLK
jgi:carboxyl-terminal processing protease